MRAIKYFFVALVAVGSAGFFLFFLLENDQRVRLCLASQCTREGLLSGYILLSFFFGMVFSGILFVFPLLKMKASKMGLRKQIKKYEKEIQTLRNQPLEDLPQSQSVAVAKIIDPEETLPPTYLQTP